MLLLTGSQRILTKNKQKKNLENKRAPRSKKKIRVEIEKQ